MSVLRIAHLSDPHFGTILPGVLEGLLETLNELKPDIILLTGDITQRARRRQFQDAKKFTHALPAARFIAVPGNHDIPLFNLFARLFNPYFGFKNLFKDQLEKDHRIGDILVTGLNSTSQWRHVQGAFDCKRLEKRLKAQSESPLSSPPKVHIAAFHHPMDCAKPQDEKNLLIGRDQVIEILARYRVDLIIGGHIHDPYVALSTVRYPKTERTMIIGVAGTCASWRTRKNAPNSFNLIEVDTRSTPLLTIHRFDQQPNLHFGITSSHRFSKASEAGWQVISDFTQT